MPKSSVNCITLPVDDLQRSFTYYRDGLGMLTKEAPPSPGQDHFVIRLSDYLYLVMILRNKFSGFAKIANQATAHKEISECILSHFADSNEEVDLILKRTVQAGGVMHEPARQQQWGYAGYVTDPDGHIWEIMYNSKMDPKVRTGEEVDEEFRTTSFGIC